MAVSLAVGFSILAQVHGFTPEIPETAHELRLQTFRISRSVLLSLEKKRTSV
jgi:hypothetical protein